jgi:uroporphyrinogen III methyltransferase / synthase
VGATGRTGALAGHCIVVTRPDAQAGALTDALTSLGAETLHLAAVRTEPMADRGELGRVVRALGGYDWVVFTSANGVAHFWEGLSEAGLGPEVLSGTRVCAIGPATAEALASRGRPVDLVPATHVGEAAAEALLAAGAGAGSRVLLPRAAEARAVLPETLRAHGVQVHDLAVYRTVVDGGGAQAVRDALRREEVDVVTFTAGSIVRSFVNLVGSDVGRALTASIGPITSAALRNAGLPVDIEARRHTVPGLVDAVVSRLVGAEEA